MPQVSSDSYEDKNMWKGWVFVLQGRFKDMAKKPMDHTAIARLIRQHGGEVHSRVTDVTKLRNRSVKHYVLVTTIEEVVKTRGMNVQRAIQQGKERWRIVQFEFIEDSVLGDKGKVTKGKAVRKSRPDLHHHEIDQVLKRMKRFADMRAMYKDQAYGHGAANGTLVSKDTHHLYVDTTKFKYDVVLKREVEKVDKRGREKVDAKRAEKQCFEKYTLKLFESNAKPVTYKFGVNYNKPGQKTIHILDHLDDNDFATKYRQFKDFFKKKTGIPWDKRLDGIMVTSLEKANQKGKSKNDGETEAEDKRPFIYTPPHRELPRGEMPHGWKDRVQIALEKEEKAKALRLLQKEAARLAEIEEEMRQVEEAKARTAEMERMVFEHGEVSDPSECGWDSVGSDSD